MPEQIERGIKQHEVVFGISVAATVAVGLFGIHRYSTSTARRIADLMNYLNEIDKIKPFLGDDFEQQECVKNLASQLRTARFSELTKNFNSLTNGLESTIGRVNGDQANNFKDQVQPLLTAIQSAHNEDALRNPGDNRYIAGNGANLISNIADVVGAIENIMGALPQNQSADVQQSKTCLQQLHREMRALQEFVNAVRNHPSLDAIKGYLWGYRRGSDAPLPLDQLLGAGRLKNLVTQASSTLTELKGRQLSAAGGLQLDEGAIMQEGEGDDHLIAFN